MPRFEGLDLDARLSALDLLQLATASTPLDPVSAGQPLRARVSGEARLVLRPLEQGQAPRLTLAHGQTAPTLFEGTVSLSGAKVNQLDVVLGLQGYMAVSSHKISLRARGSRCERGKGGRAGGGAQDQPEIHGGRGEGGGRGAGQVTC